MEKRKEKVLLFVATLVVLLLTFMAGYRVGTARSDDDDDPNEVIWEGKIPNGSIADFYCQNVTAACTRTGRCSCDGGEIHFDEEALLTPYPYGR